MGSKLSSSNGHSLRDYQDAWTAAQQHAGPGDHMAKGLVVAAYLKVERSKFSSSKGHSFRDYQDACNTKDDFMTTAQWTSQLTWTAVTDLKLSRAGGGWERMQHTSMFVNKPQLGVG